MYEECTNPWFICQPSYENSGLVLTDYLEVTYVSYREWVYEERFLKLKELSNWAKPFSNKGLKLSQQSDVITVQTSGIYLH